MFVSSAFVVSTHAQPIATGTQLRYDNGGFINHPGQGPNGADMSIYPSGWGVWGVPAVEYYGARVVDDFTIPSGQTWNMASARFFLYEWGTTTSLFTRMSLRIWDGSPANPNSHVIWGNTTANVMSGTGFTGVYVTTADYSASIYSMMWLDASINLSLPAGTYWLDWAASLSDYSRGDPYQGPIPADLATRTGNALWTPSSPNWGRITDAGRPLDYPFQIFTVIPEPSVASILLVGVLGFRRFAGVS